MFKKLQTLACFAVLAATPFLHGPAHAESYEHQGEIQSEERIERQDLREERQQIRTQHEQLEAERDALKTRCTNAGGQDASDCRQKMQSLHEQREAFHQRVQSFHARAESYHQRHPHRSKHGGNRKNAVPAQPVSGSEPQN